ncbi:unnamed protein product [Amoebophrya sp. A120]|nr:unnamed protein product [Amoebophrya sp. A120]|eukprot:GSA120T00001357001.1
MLSHLAPQRMYPSLLARKMITPSEASAKRFSTGRSHRGTLQHSCPRGRFIPEQPIAFRNTFGRGFLGSRSATCSAGLRVRPNLSAVSSCAAATSTISSKSSPLFDHQRRTLFDWALRPYACAAVASSAVPLSTLSAGFSKCSLSLLVAPWKALPTALVILPAAWAVPAVYRLCFSNCSRGAVAGVFTFFMQFTLTFLPVPAFENLFAELTFYITALCMTFFMYNLFPELMLEDGIWIFYSALFVLPMLPLAFSYLPLFATRTYFIL